jgi:GTP pyrophosphokinase
MLDERRIDRERYIDEVVSTLKKELADAGIKADVTGRPKHIYSIWSKMQRKQAGIDMLYDIRAVRILVESVKALLHGARPRSPPVDAAGARVRRLHRQAQGQQLPVAAYGGHGPEGKPLEVQIRTWDMHQHSEYGVAATGGTRKAARRRARADPTFDEKIAWLRQVLD